MNKNFKKYDHYHSPLLNHIGTKLKFIHKIKLKEKIMPVFFDRCGIQGLGKVFVCQCDNWNNSELEGSTIM